MRETRLGLAAVLVVIAILVVAIAPKVVDFAPPELVLEDGYEASYGTKIYVYDLVKSVTDRGRITLTLSGEGEVDEEKKSISFPKGGQYTVEVTARDSSGNHRTEQIDVTVVDKVPPRLTVKTLTAIEGKKLQYNSCVTAMDEAEGDLSDAVEVDDSRVDPNTPGTYEVTYRVADSWGNEATATGKVIIQNTPAESLSLNQKELHLNGNEYSQLQVAVKPTDWKGTLVWTSSDENVATVSDGLVYWQGAGECIITAQAEVVKAQCKVTCGEVLPTSVTLDKHMLTLEEGDQEKLSWGALPSNWTGSVKWVSSDENVATVENGTVTWKGRGSCVITAYASDEVYDTCAVTCKGLTIQEFFENIFGVGREEQEQPKESHTNNTAHNASH